MHPNEELNAKKNFYLYFKEHDRRRDTHLDSTFPELNRFIKECRELLHNEK
jgi:hypothetical protein